MQFIAHIQIRVACLLFVQVVQIINTFCSLFNYWVEVWIFFIKSTWSEQTFLRSFAHELFWDLKFNFVHSTFWHDFLKYEFLDSNETRSYLHKYLFFYITMIRIAINKHTIKLYNSNEIALHYTYAINRGSHKSFKLATSPQPNPLQICSFSIIHNWEGNAKLTVTQYAKLFIFQVL